jgi:hypothetical protein
MSKFEFSWYALLLVAMVVVFLVAFGSNDLSPERQAMVEARIVHCDMGQIPLDCIQNPNKRRGKKSSERNYIAR